jgi:hypothetical protein
LRFQHLTNLFREAQEKNFISTGFRPEIIALMYTASIKALANTENRIQYAYTAKTAHEHAIDVFLEGLKLR